MNRRNFVAGIISCSAGLLLPYEPKVIYSFPNKLGPFDLTDDIEYFYHKLYRALDIPKSYRISARHFKTIYLKGAN